MKQLNIVSLRVRSARRRLHISQSALSARLHSVGVSISRSGVVKIEAGRRKVKDFELVGIAKALRTGVGRLLGEKPSRRK